ncbi:hypothetical protein AB0C76_41450 [Kitasatospora sp. NPDC048722]|uniref:hypothetical protein n=1 Tax=Kitasatospora sp. NPDC048722 TaxID=3155639 RepID=UPI0033FBB759
MNDVVAGDITHTSATTLLRGGEEDDTWFGQEIFVVVPGVGQAAPAQDVDGIVTAANNNATGVAGQGTVGVAGWTRDQDRARATEVNNPSGVLGMGGKSPGVTGIGNPGVRGDGDTQTGVFGTALGNGGLGVSGVGRSTGVQGIGLEFGVIGSTNSLSIGSDNPKSVALDGSSNLGTAVQGRSQYGRGGWFYSHAAGQIRLEPAVHSGVADMNQVTPEAVTFMADGSPIPLPKLGMIGDLYTMVVTLPHASDEPARPLCTLWLCVQSVTEEAPDQFPAQWVQILTSTDFVSGSR